MYALMYKTHSPFASCSSEGSGAVMKHVLHPYLPKRLSLWFKKREYLCESYHSYLFFVKKCFWITLLERNHHYQTGCMKGVHNYTSNHSFAITPISGKEKNQLIANMSHSLHQLLSVILYCEESLCAPKTEESSE